MKVHRIQGIAFSSYLLETPDALFLVDSGFLWFDGLVRRKIRAIGRRLEDLRLVVLTHPHLDHIGAVPALRRRAAFEIVAHPRARAILAGGGKAFSPSRQSWTKAVELLATTAFPFMILDGIEPTLELPDGARLDDHGLSATILHTPGHSDSCISLVHDDGTAFVGDLMIGAGHMTTRVSPPAMAADPRGSIRSMRKLLDAGARRVMPAHGRAFTGADVVALLDRLGHAAE